MAKILEEKNQKIWHRGPDEAGVWIENNRGMGMQRLSIIEIMTGPQPMHNPSNNTTIVFNGEIYNVRALRQELTSQGCVFRSSSDTEVLIQAYRVWGIALVEHLQGMFSIAIWDDHKQQLFLLRYPVGQKPLFLGLTSAYALAF